jgi:hypothetical protein
MINKALDSGRLPPAISHVLLKEVDISVLARRPDNEGTQTPPPLIVLHGLKLYTIEAVFTDVVHARDHVNNMNWNGKCRLVSCMTNQPLDAVRDEGAL